MPCFSIGFAPDSGTGAESVVTLGGVAGLSWQLQGHPPIAQSLKGLRNTYRGKYDAYIEGLEASMRKLGQCEAEHAGDDRWFGRYAAIYLSLGMESAREFVLEQIGDTLGEINERDFKSRLQEYTQDTLRATPTYRIVGEQGPPHDRSFIAQVSVKGKIIGQGTGRSKKVAEQAAAELALEKLFECPTSLLQPNASL